MSNQLLNEHVATLVTEDYRTADVFRRYGMDFCCGGKRPLKEACEKKGINPDEVVKELEHVMVQPAAGMPRFREWSADLLIEYIQQNHHTYVRSAIPRISQWVNKVAQRHGHDRPENVEIAKLFEELSDAMIDHLEKEENEQFPLVSSVLEKKKQGENPDDKQRQELNRLHEELETEHEHAGDTMAKIAELSNNFTPPEWACPTYQLAYKELSDFEKDLHQHVHLENNLLFPKATQLINN